MDEIKTAVQAAYDDDGAEFLRAVEAAIMGKIEANMEERKKEIAQNLIAQPEAA